MNKIKKTILTLALLMTAVTGAWATLPETVYYRVYDYSDGKLTYTDNEIAGTGVTEVTNSTTEWANGTYVVTATTTISSRITVTGTVNLIILDGATLTAEKGITVSDDNTLNIYMGNSSNSIQSTGQLNATAVEDMEETINMETGIPVNYDIRGAGIGGYLVLDGMEFTPIIEKIDCGNVNIHGGKINVQNERKIVAGIGGAEYGAGGNITIYHSKVTAYGNELVSAIGAGKSGSGGTVAIYGGNVNAIVTNIYNTTTPGIGASLTVGKDVQVYALSGSKSPDEDLSDDTNVAPEGGGQVTTFNNSMFTRYTGSAPAASSASSGPEVAWDKAKKTGTFTMPGDNVFVVPDYYPQAALTAEPTAINDVPATTDGAIVKAGTVANIGSTETAQGTVMYYVSPTALDDAALLALAADAWKADVPTAKSLAQGQAYVYYYVRGNDSDTDAENFSDGDILAANALTVTIAAEPTYAVTFAEGTQDADKWTVKAGTDGSFQSLPLEGVKAGTKVKLKYDGDRSMLKGVKAKLKKPAATVKTITIAVDFHTSGEIATAPEITIEYNEGEKWSDVAARYDWLKMYETYTVYYDADSKRGDLHTADGGVQPSDLVDPTKSYYWGYE